MNGLKMFTLWACVAALGGGLTWLAQQQLGVKFPIYAVTTVALLGLGLFRLLTQPIAKED